MHVDIHTDNLDAEVARLEALGAERVEATGHWVVMRDPAGLIFCVVPEQAGSFDRAARSAGISAVRSGRPSSW